jgi:type II secretory pathway pseudopilin PulG
MIFRRRPSESAAVLLEILLAVALFVAASAVVTTSLNSSIQALDRQHLRLHAANLASSILAEIQMGARSSTPSPAQALEAPFQEWTFEVVGEPSPSDFSGVASLEQVTVVVRHQTEPVVHRLSQRLPPRSTPMASDVRTESRPAP